MCKIAKLSANRLWCQIIRNFFTGETVGSRHSIQPNRGRLPALKPTSTPVEYTWLYYRLLYILCTYRMNIIMVPGTGRRGRAERIKRNGLIFEQVWVSDNNSMLRKQPIKTLGSVLRKSSAHRHALSYWMFRLVVQVYSRSYETGIKICKRR